MSSYERPPRFFPAWHVAQSYFLKSSYPSNSSAVIAASSPRSHLSKREFGVMRVRSKCSIASVIVASLMPSGYTALNDFTNALSALSFSTMLSNDGEAISTGLRGGPAA